MKIPFHKPVVPNSFSTIFPKSIKDGWLTTGPEVKNFENKLSQYNNSKYSIAVNSCTAALHLALAAKGFKSGDKFIVPTYTFVATVEVGEYLGMSPILIDCDKNFNIDIDQIEDLILFSQQLNLNVIGLMCIPPANEEPDKYFKEIKLLNKKFNLSEISMGMSSDYLKAVENSSTYLRIGSSIFGQRS